MQRRMIEGLSFVATVVLVTVAFLWLMLPYYGAILWAAILAIIFHPIHRRILAAVHGRHNLAAFLTLGACIALAVFPGALLLAALAREATWLYTALSTQTYDIPAGFRRVQEVLPDFVLEALALLGLDDFAELQRRITSLLGQAAQFVAGRAVIIGQSTAQFVIALGVMLYLLFFLFRDGMALVAVIRRASPLNERHTRRVFDKFASAVKAAVKGSITIAVVQGTIGGLAFWLLGIKAALLWGAAMAVLSLLPAIGAALVWTPVALYLLATGEHWRGLALMAAGLLVISTIDNLLRPMLVGKDLRLPDFLILLSMLGGLALLGMNGFVVGPLVAALFVAVWSLFVDEQKPA